MSARLPAVLAVVAVGGVLGSLARAVVSALTHGVWLGGGATGTLIVNVVGAVAIGYVGARSSASAWWVRPFAITGVLGGFTTFSAYALETAGLMESDALLALGYLVATVGLGVAGVALGARASGTHR